MTRIGLGGKAILGTKKKNPMLDVRHTDLHNGVLREISLWQKRNPQRILPNVILQTSELLDKLKGISEQTRHAAKINVSRSAFLASCAKEIASGKPISVKQLRQVLSSSISQSAVYLEKNAKTASEAELLRLATLKKECEDVLQRISRKQESDFVKVDANVLMLSAILNFSELKSILGERKYKEFYKAQEKTIKIALTGKSK
jgi:hypothetical protein